MKTVDEVLGELETRADAQTRKTLLGHGAPSNTFGVKIADLKVVAKSIKGNQSLACELYKTGNSDAMYLAGIVADGTRMKRQELEAWAQGAPWSMIAETTVPSVAVESPFARELALSWIRSKKELIAACGWCTYSGIVATRPDDELDLAEIETLLNQVVDQIHRAPNEVRSAMNGFVISVGAYVTPLLKQAKRAAKAIGAVSVDMGDTACKVPVASEYIEKVESMGRVGKKRKTMKC